MAGQTRLELVPERTGGLRSASPNALPPRCRVSNDALNPLQYLVSNDALNPLRYLVSNTGEW